MSRNSTMDLTTGHPLKQLQTQPCGQTFYGLLFLFTGFLCSRQVSRLYAILVLLYKGGASTMKRSNIHLQYNAPVTLTFFFLSLASLALGHLTNGWTTYHLFSVYRSSLADPLFLSGCLVMCWGMQAGTTL